LTERDRADFGSKYGLLFLTKAREVLNAEWILLSPEAEKQRRREGEREKERDGGERRG